MKATINAHTTASIPKTTISPPFQAKKNKAPNKPQAM